MGRWRQVLMAGVGQCVNNTVLSDAPQMAVFVQGNDHQLLDSQIRDVVQQCNDVRHFLTFLPVSCLPVARFVAFC